MTEHKLEALAMLVIATWLLWMFTGALAYMLTRNDTVGLIGMGIPTALAFLVVICACLYAIYFAAREALGR